MADTESHTIRRIALRNGVISTVMRTGARGDGPNPYPLKFSLLRPHGVLFSGGVVYVSDREADRILVLRWQLWVSEMSLRVPAEAHESSLR